MSLFKSRLATLSMRSEDAIGVFTKTVNKLKGINQELVDEQESKRLEARLLNDEIDELSKVETQNKQFISKIEAFLS